MSEQQNLLTPNNQYNQPSNLPNATASLVLGIISIVIGLCPYTAFFGMICGIIGLVLGNKDRGLYRTNPDFYSSASHGQSNSGRTCSIIGMVIAGLWLLFVIIMLITVGSLSWRYGNNSWR